MGLGKGVLLENGRVLEFAANCRQGRVQMLYTYIGLNLNVAISVIKFYHVLYIYIKVNS